jgi:hypothetical protein
LSLEWDLVVPELQHEILQLHELHKTWLNSIFKKIDLRIPKSDAVMGTMSLIQGSIQLARLNNEPNLVIKNLKTYLKSIKK